MEHKEKDEIIRNYKYWSGLNEFYCNGHIMIGPNGLRILSVSTIAINLPAIGIYVFGVLVKYNNL